MKNSIFSIFTLLLAFATLQTANAQTKTAKEAQELYQTVIDLKGDLAEVKKAIVMHEAKAGDGQNAIIVHELKADLDAMQNFFNRVERTKGKMTAAQLAGFKAELLDFSLKADALEAKNQTQSLTGDPLWKCIDGCKKTFSSYWLFYLRMLCISICFLK